MSGSPESGTPIDALESGNVTNAADASRMAEILRDMNASGADVAAGQQVAQQPQMQMPSKPCSRNKRWIKLILSSKNQDRKQHNWQQPNTKTRLSSSRPPPPRQGRL
jgi:hypothetical protein